MSRLATEFEVRGHCPVAAANPPYANATANDWQAVSELPYSYNQSSFTRLRRSYGGQVSSSDHYGRGAGVGRGEPVGAGGGVQRGGGVGRPAEVGLGLGVGAHLPVHGVGVGVGVGVGGGCAQYLPPVFKSLLLSDPPQMIISPPVQTAVCSSRAVGALVMLVAVQLSVLGSCLPPVFK